MFQFHWFTCGCPVFPVPLAEKMVFFPFLYSCFLCTTSHQSEWLSLISPQITNAGEVVEKREPSYTVGTLVEPLWKTVWRYLRKLESYQMTQQSHSLCLCIYPDKTFLEKDTCAHMFIATLFTIAKTWKKPKCPSTDEWIKKMWYIDTVEYYSSIKKNKIMPSAATWMELDTRTKWSKSERERQMPCDITYIWNLIYSTNKPFHRKETHGLEEQTCGCQRGGSRIEWESAVNRCKLLHLEWISNEILLYSTGNYI